MLHEKVQGMCRLGFVVAVLTSLGFASSAVAMVTYAYQGNNFGAVQDLTPSDGMYDTSMRVTGSFTLDLDALPSNVGVPDDLTPFLTELVLSDGRHTLRLSDDPTPVFAIATDSEGAITDWVLALDRIDSRGPLLIAMGIATENSRDDVFTAIQTGEHDRAIVVGNPGTWTLVPEPATGGLMGLGLLGLAASGRRR